MPKVSVVMSVYNGEKYLREAVESILTQTFDDFEFLIVDDCSTDASPGILNDYQQRDKRIKVIKNGRNIGLTRSLNKAIKQSSGDYIARLDADDISLPQRLEKQYLFLTRNPLYSIVGTRTCLIDSDGRFIKKQRRPIFFRSINKIMLKRNCLAHGTVMINRKDLISVGNYNKKIPFAQDYELWLRFVRSNKKIFVLNDYLYYLRQHQGSVTARNVFHQSITFFLIQKRIDFEKFDNNKIEEYFSVFDEKTKANVYYVASRLILRSNIVESLEYCKDSMKYYRYNIHTCLLFCYIMMNVLSRKVMKHT
jgi:glycosyltransferase involved in cell wall biosynthesis